VRLLLFSGGLDSTALAWWLKPDQLLFLDYGQVPAAGEERASVQLARELRIPFEARRVDLSAFGSGLMAGGSPDGVHPPEFWPYRNQMLITLAAMAYAERALTEIIIGTVRSDKLHPDGRQSFLRTVDRLVKIQSGVRVAAPASRLSTLQLVQQSKVPLSVLGWTFSCHTGVWACGSCRGCLKHDEVIGQIAAEVDDIPANLAAEPVVPALAVQDPRYGNSLLAADWPTALQPSR
jgi:7-cyano-7-deazaguanine synthase